MQMRLICIREHGVHGIVTVHPHTKIDICRSVGPSAAAGKLPNGKCELSKIIMDIKMSRARDFEVLRDPMVQLGTYHLGYSS